MDTAYSSGFVSMKLNKLLDSDGVQRMINAEDINDALSVLLSYDYDSLALNSRPINIDSLIERELESTIEFFSEYCVDKHLKQAVLKRFDYHNAKAFLKAQYSNAIEEEIVYSAGLIAREDLKEAISQKDYEWLPQCLAEALIELDTIAFDGSLDGKTIDVKLDKAMFKDIALNARHIKSGALRYYFALSADVSNIMIAARLRKLRARFSDSVDQFVDGGKVPLDKFEVLMNEVSSKVVKEFLEYEFVDIVESLCKYLERNENLFEAENELTELLFSKSREGILNTFSDEPLFAWLHQKLAELKTIKLIAIAKKNNLSESDVRKRLRSIYA